jgi:cytochrome P450
MPAATSGRVLAVLPRTYTGRVRSDAEVDHVPVMPGPAGLLEARPWLRALRRDPLEALTALRHRYGDVAQIPVPGRRRLVLVAHPDGVQQVLQTHHRRYRKAPTFEVLASLLGRGLLTAEGDEWRTHRRLAQPAFHRDRVAGWGDMMVERTRDHVGGWKHGAELDLAEHMRGLTLRIVGEALFSTDLTRERDRIGEALDVALDYTRQRFQSPLGPFVDPPTPTRARFRRAAARLDRVVWDMVATRDRDDPGDDLLGLLMAAEDTDTGEGLTDVELRDEVLTFLLAGHETTAHALAWTLWALARSGEPWRRARDEIDRVLGDRPATTADLGELPYVRAVVDEGMRLYPPAWTTERTPIEADVIDGYGVGEGDIVMTSPWVTHRHPGLWDRPLAFDPDRFVEGGPPHRFAHFPFGGGPRMCIGADFALVEATLVMASLLQVVDVDPVPGFPVVPRTGVTLRPAHGIRVVVSRRRDQRVPSADDDLALTGPPRHTTST